MRHGIAAYVDGIDCAQVPDPADERAAVEVPALQVRVRGVLPPHPAAEDAVQGFRGSPTGRCVI